MTNLIIFYGILLILTLWGCKFSGKKFFAEESFSKDVTNSVKGVFIWLVFLRHFPDYVRYKSILDVLGGAISGVLGQMIVACFLLYSGYGIFESFKKKGSVYVRSLPTNRILKTLIHFDIAVLLFLIIRIAIGKKIMLSQILFSFIGWKSIGNSNWYIFVILMLYLITWLSFNFAKDNIKKAGIWVTALSIVMVVAFYFTRSSWWYDTILCFVLGVWISIYKDKFLAFITKNNVIWAIAAVMSMASFGLLRGFNFFVSTNLIDIVNLLTAPVFCIMLIAFLTKVKISNRVLAFSGNYLFEIYILQRIPLMLFKTWGLAKFNMYLYFVVCVVFTVVLAVIFRFLTNKLDKIFLKN